MVFQEGRDSRAITKKAALNHPKNVYYVTRSALMERDSRKLIKLLEEDGWFEIGITGSHHHFKHPTKPGKVTPPS
jgi:hypothetical protein